MTGPLYLLKGFLIRKNSAKVSGMGFHKSQIFFYLLSTFIVGIFLASVFDFSKSLILVILITAISIIVLAPPLKNQNFSRAGLLIAFMLVVLAVSAIRFNQLKSSNNSLEEFLGQEVALTGYIDSEPETDGNRARFVLKTKNGERIMVTTNAFPKRKFGDQLEVAGELQLPVNFGEFDYITYLRKEGIRTIIFYPKEIRESNVGLNLGDKIKVMIYHNIFALKSRFQKAINLSVSEPNAAFINGILLGTRQGISDNLKNAFSKTGTTHILAISGYNIMIISEAVLAGLIYFFRRRTAFWFSVAIIILFVILTGASASVVRAAIMGLLLSFARGYGRLYDQKNSIILAGAVMIYHNPFVLVFDVGFQLSFAAVLGLIYLYPRLDYILKKILPILFSIKSRQQNRGSSISEQNQNNFVEIGTEWGKLKEITLMTISAQLAVSPLILYYFGNFSLISLPANILILPFVPAAMLLGFISGLAGMVAPILGQIAGYAAWAITTYQIAIVEYFSLF